MMEKFTAMLASDKIRLGILKDCMELMSSKIS